MPAVNDVGEPCAGEPHARFDGRELETERPGHGHRSGTTRRETAGTKASGPNTRTSPPRQLPTLRDELIMRAVLIMGKGAPTCENVGI